MRGQGIGWGTLINHSCYKLYLDFPGISDSKEFAYNARDLGLLPGLGRSPGEGNWLPTPVFLLGEFQARGAWQATVHGVAKSWDTTEQLT